MDDDWCIYENSIVQKLTKENLKKIWLNETVDMFYLPTTFTSFAIDVALWGNNAKMMRIENLALFVICGFLIFYFLNTIGLNEFISFITSVLFLCHPFQIETIALPTGRRQVLLMLFLLLTCLNIYNYIKSENKSKIGYYLFALLFYFLALGSKPQGLMLLPILFFANIIYLFQRNNLSHTLRRAFITILPFALISIFFVLMNREASERNFLQQDLGYTNLQHALIILSSFGFYIPKIIIGHYSIFYPVQTAVNFNYLSMTLYSLITVVIALISCFYLIKKKYYLSFSLLWFLFFLVPPSLLIFIYSDFPLNTADRYFFIASPGIFLYISIILSGFSKNIKIVILPFIVLFFFIKSFYQIKVWNNSITVFSHNVKHYPNKEFLYRIALIQFKNGKFIEAFEALDEASTIKSDVGFNNTFYFDLELAYIYQSKGDTITSMSLVKNVLIRDVQFGEQFNDTLILNYISGIFPLSDEYVENIHNYTNLRNEIIEISRGHLKSKRL